jgi:hypothetical protein
MKGASGAIPARSPHRFKAAAPAQKQGLDQSSKGGCGRAGLETTRAGRDVGVGLGFSGTYDGDRAEVLWLLKRRKKDPQRSLEDTEIGRRLIGQCVE